MLHIDPATVAAITPSAVLSAIEAHERTYGAYLYGLCDKGADLGELREAERAAFHKLVHVPLANDAERVAYAVAVIARENSPVGRLGEGRGRNDPLAVAFRNLSFGEHAWEPEGGTGVVPLAGDAPDPVLATIEENRRLFEAWSAALELPNSGKDERQEVTEAREAYTAHTDDILLKTVPTSGQGCKALAEYVHGHYARDRYIIDENEHSDANFRVLSLIAGSPATGASQVVPAGSAESPDLAAMLAEWGTLDAKMRANAATDAESDRHAALQLAIYRFPSSSLADLHAKLPVFRDEMKHAREWVGEGALPEEVHCCASWLGLIADIERLGVRAVRPVATPEADPVIAAIAESRKASAASEELYRQRSGPMSGAEMDRESALTSKEYAARCAVWKTPPTTQAGRRALVEFARQQIEPHSTVDGWIEIEGVLPEIFGALAAMVEAETSPQAVASAVTLLDSVEREWAAQIVGEREDHGDMSAEADARHDARNARREALMLAAEALPAGSRDARQAKALAFAWDASIMLWHADRTRDQYGTDGRLMIDLMDSLTGEVRAAPTVAPKVDGTEATTDLSGYSVPQLCALFGVYDRAADHFYSTAWWPKLGEDASGLVTDEGDRCTALKVAMADELQRRKPVDGTGADDRGEMLMRQALGRGDWDATARLASSLRDEVSALQGEH